MISIKHQKIVFILIIILSFISCTQTVPEVKMAKSTVIFDYTDSAAFPEARLAVYVQSETNVNRYDSLKLTSPFPGYMWETKEISKLVLSNKTYVGYTNFSLPEGMKLPAGNYTAVYVNADEKNAEINVSVNYDSKIYDLKSSEIDKYMMDNNGDKKIAVYDSDNVLIFYGDYDFTSSEDVKRKYKNGNTYNIVWNCMAGSVMCILPSENL